MEIKQALTCPISIKRVDENAARIAAFIIILLTLACLYWSQLIIAFLLAFDFAVRAFTGTQTPIQFTARQLAKWMRLQPKPVDAAPKKFAAALGLIFTFLIGLFLLLQWPFAAVITGGILIFCAFLEGAFAYCLGCVVYTYAIMPFKK